MLRYFSFKLQFTPKLNFRCKPQPRPYNRLNTPCCLSSRTKQLRQLCRREKSCQRFATKCRGGKLHKTFLRHWHPSVSTSFCEISGLLRGINWWSVSHLVEEHFYHHFGGFDNFFEGGTVPLSNYLRSWLSPQVKTMIIFHIIFINYISYTLHKPHLYL